MIGKRRKVNQDYVYTTEQPVGKLPNLFIVADGMGGYKAGEFASKCTVETIVNEVCLSSEKGTIRLLTSAIQKANAKIRQKSTTDENYQGMGTTLVAATFDGRGLCVANVGDSRLYIYSNGIRQITTDHSLVEEMVRMGGLERAKARTHPDKNIITRAIGVVEQVDIDFFEVDQINSGDIVLMCSDGLSNMIEDSEMERIIGGAGTLEEKANMLIAAANQNGGRDNISLVLVHI